jgi:hypothetical protein
MLFMIMWEADPEKLMEGMKLFKEGKFPRPEGVKHIVEYGTPSGLFVEIVEASNSEDVYKYVMPALKFHKRIDVYPALRVEDVYNLF